MMMAKGHLHKYKTEANPRRDQNALKIFPQASLIIRSVNQVFTRFKTPNSPPPLSLHYTIATVNMFSLTTTTSLLLLAVTATSALPHVPQPTASNSTTCADVHVFLARGTGEDYPGRQINVVYAVCNDTVSASPSSTCDYEDIVYPASALFPAYCTSVGNGVSSGTEQITEYAERCPDAQLVLSGYSQGAQVTGNILGGQAGGETGCTDETGTGLDISTSPANQSKCPSFFFPSSPLPIPYPIFSPSTFLRLALLPPTNTFPLVKAVTLFGDVTHVANQTYNTATGAGADGLEPRTGTQLERLNVYSAVIQSWCLIDDPVCAQGDNGTVHTTYFDIFSEAAGEWVVGQLSL